MKNLLNVFQSWLPVTGRALALIAFSCLVASSFAQSVTPWVLSTTGSHGAVSSCSVSSTIGEPIIKTVSSPTMEYITQGFQQPLDVVIGVIEPLPRGWDAMAYPNPFGDEIFVDITTLKNEEYEVSIYNLLGQKENLPVEELQTGGKMLYRFDTSRLSLGSYVVLVVPKGGGDKAVNLKVIKIR